MAPRVLSLVPVALNPEMRDSRLVIEPEEQPAHLPGGNFCRRST